MKKRKIKKSSKTKEMKEEHKTAGKSSVFSSQEDVYSFEFYFCSLTAALESVASWISICRTVHWRATAWSSRWYATVQGNWERFGNAKQEKVHKPEGEHLKSYPKLKGFRFCYTTVQAMDKVLA